MKRIFSLLLIALLLGVATSCKGNEDASDSSDQRSFTAEQDSLASDLGTIMGAQFRSQIESLPGNAASDIDMEEFKKGFEMIMKCDTSMKSQSYLNGINAGMMMYARINQLENDGINVNRDQVIKSFMAIASSKEPLNDEMLMAKSQALMQKISGASSKSLANKQAGEKYIEEQMKKDKAFIKTKSGLCYKIIQEGKGENFKENDNVDVIYVGKHIDGTEFDSSKGNTVNFPLQNVVKGFREVITLMKPGSKAIAIIPGNLGYGESGAGPIGPNETLVFEITTVGLHK